MKRLLILITMLFTATQYVAGQVRVVSPDSLLLKDFAPRSIFNIPQTFVDKPKYPVIDAHTHDYAADKPAVAKWVQAMDDAGVEVSYIMTCNWLGQPIDSMVVKYADYPTRFRFLCSFDYTGFGQPDWEQRALASLQHDYDLGAAGVGEMDDKGLGDLYAYPVEGRGIHLDNPRLRPLLRKCGELGLPVCIHVADPIWMYEPMDASNDGLINGYLWRADTTAQGCLGYEALMHIFENTVAANPGTTFVACHFLNMNHDLPRLARMLDKYPNLYIDIAARLAESTATPRATRAFMIKYADRILFGTDIGMEAAVYRNVYRVLETDDEHFYNRDYHNYGYIWALNGLHLPDDVLKKIYRDNALKLFRR